MDHARVSSDVIAGAHRMCALSLAELVGTVRMMRREARARC